MSEDPQIKYTQEQLRDMMLKGEGQEYLEHGLKDNPLLMQTISASILPISRDEIKRALDDNEIGDAYLFCRLFRGRLCFDHAEGKGGQWYIFNGHYWERDKVENVLPYVREVVDVYDSEIRALAKERDEFIESGNQKKAIAVQKLIEVYVKRKSHLNTRDRRMRVLAIARAGEHSLGVSGENWDADPWLLACANGVLGLRTGECKPGQPEQYIRHACPARWESVDEQCPLWEQTLLEIFDGDDAMVTFLQRLLGYAITGRQTENICAILQGRGRSGKTVILGTMKSILGVDQADLIPTETLMEQKFAQSGSGASADIMDIWGKRIIWASESSTTHMLNESRLKQWTGGDPIKGRYPFGQRMISFMPTHTLFLLTNFTPKANANDYALWQRILLIQFPLSFIEKPVQPYERKKDPLREDRIKSTEISGILAWLVRGCLEWQQNGLQVPEKVIQHTLQYKKDEDHLGTFLDDCTTIDEYGMEQSQTVYDAYRAWCKHQQGVKPWIQKTFSMELKKRLESKPVYGRIYFLGIKLREDIDTNGEGGSS